MATGNVMEREAPPVAARFWARRSVGYNGKQYDRGQVGKLAQLQNDRLLLDLGYLVLMDKDAKTFPCRACGEEFVDQGLRDGHGKNRHDGRTAFVPPPRPTVQPGESMASFQNRLDAWAQAAGAQADSNDERKSSQEDQVAPLDLTKTTASRTA